MLDGGVRDDGVKLGQRALVPGVAELPRGQGGEVGVPAVHLGVLQSGYVAVRGSGTGLPEGMKVS